MVLSQILYGLADDDIEDEFKGEYDEDKNNLMAIGLVITSLSLFVVGTYINAIAPLRWKAFVR